MPRADHHTVCSGGSNNRVTSDGRLRQSPAGPAVETITIKQYLCYLISDDTNYTIMPEVASTPSATDTFLVRLGEWKVSHTEIVEKHPVTFSWQLPISWAP